MTTINPTTAGNGVRIVPKGEGSKPLGQADFLKLMTAQLRQQDPFNPLDNTEMVAQMAQFSSVAGIGEINVSLKSIADQIGQQTTLLADIKAATVAPAPVAV
jgi:flagellar basal-body rod modification protein FlgD